MGEQQRDRLQDRGFGAVARTDETIEPWTWMPCEVLNPTKVLNLKLVNSHDCLSSGAVRSRWWP